MIVVKNEIWLIGSCFVITPKIPWPSWYVKSSENESGFEVFHWFSKFNETSPNPPSNQYSSWEEAKNSFLAVSREERSYSEKANVKLLCRGVLTVASNDFPLGAHQSDLNPIEICLISYDPESGTYLFVKHELPPTDYKGHQENRRKSLPLEEILKLSVVQEFVGRVNEVWIDAGRQVSVTNTTKVIDNIELTEDEMVDLGYGKAYRPHPCCSNDEVQCEL